MSEFKTQRSARRTLEATGSSMGSRSGTVLDMETCKRANGTAETVAPGGAIRMPARRTACAVQKWVSSFLNLCNDMHYMSAHVQCEGI